jgi:hypothetical protein
MTEPRKRGRQVIGIGHIGSAHDEDRLALLMQTATQRLHADQHALELDLAPPGTADPGSPVVEATGSLILWDALCGVYDALGFAAVDDEAFRRGRVDRRASSASTVRAAVLDPAGALLAGWRNRWVRTAADGPFPALPVRGRPESSAHSWPEGRRPR